MTENSQLKTFELPTRYSSREEINFFTTDDGDTHITINRGGVEIIIYPTVEALRNMKRGIQDCIDVQLLKLEQTRIE